MGNSFFSDGEDPKNRYNKILKEIETFETFFAKNYNSSSMTDEEIQVLHSIKTEFFRRRCAAHADYGHLHITP